ncbi:MAG: sulfatase/phosphatase domain-containing protein, partial [Verrucomicrobiota bacterium]|nr:sulfatase/phosphatase domain-containing protein [Verrucomicrobiota bacterium]
YEGGVRVPGLLEWPSKVKPKTSTNFPASTVDYLPTILAALNIKMPDNRPTDGIDLSSAIEGKTKIRQNALGFQSGSMASFITHRYKLISKKEKKSDKDGNRLELYDLLKDPHEKNNIASKNKDTVKELSIRLEDWIQSCAKSDKGKDYNKKTQKIQSNGS